MLSLDFVKDYLPPAIKNLPTHMDYDGQKNAEKLFQIVIVLSGVVGIAVGYWQQQYSLTMYSVFAGFLLAALLVLPPWPMYRTQKLTWLAPRPAADGSGAPPTTSIEKGSSKKKK